MEIVDVAVTGYDSYSEVNSFGLLYEKETLVVENTYEMDLKEHMI